MKKLKIAFFGVGGEASALPLKRLIEADFNISLIVQSGAKPEKRSLSIEKAIKACLRPPYRFLAYRILHLRKGNHNIETIASRYHIPFLKVHGKLDTEFQEELRKHNPDLICVASFNQLLKKEVIQIPKHGIINLHPSLLPYYPGHSPLFWMIMNGEKEWGVTVHYIDEGEDTGNIIHQSRIDYSDKDSGKQLWDKLSNKGAELMIKAIKDILGNKVTSYVQPKAKNRFRARRTTFEDLVMPLQQTASESYCFLNRLLFYAKPILELEGEYYKIIKILRYTPNGNQTAKRVKNVRRLSFNRLKYFFDDGSIILKVTPILAQTAERDWRV